MQHSKQSLVKPSKLKSLNYYFEAAGKSYLVGNVIKLVSGNGLKDSGANASGAMYYILPELETMHAGILKQLSEF
jgi:hypothetical protein